MLEAEVATKHARIAELKVRGAGSYAKIETLMRQVAELMERLGR